MHDIEPLPFATHPSKPSYQSQSTQSFEDHIPTFLSRGFNHERPTLLARAAVHAILLLLKAEISGKSAPSGMTRIGAQIIDRFNSFSEIYKEHFYRDMGRELAGLIQAVPTDPSAAASLQVIQKYFNDLKFPKDGFQNVKQAGLTSVPDKKYDIPVMEFLAAVPARAVAASPEPKPEFPATRSVPTAGSVATPVVPVKAVLPPKTK